MRKLTESKENRIREDLSRLVYERLVELDCQSFVDFRHHCADATLFPEPLCPFVNVLCPDDLCFLPADHIGTTEHFHITATVAYDYAIRWGLAQYMPVGASRQELIHQGAVLQGQMRLEEIDGMG